MFSLPLSGRWYYVAAQLSLATTSIKECCRTTDCRPVQQDVQYIYPQRASSREGQATITSTWITIFLLHLISLKSAHLLFVPTIWQHKHLFFQPIFFYITSNIRELSSISRPSSIFEGEKIGKMDSFILISSTWRGFSDGDDAETESTPQNILFFWPKRWPTFILLSQR